MRTSKIFFICLLVTILIIPLFLLLCLIYYRHVRLKMAKSNSNLVPSKASRTSLNNSRTRLNSSQRKANNQKPQSTLTPSNSNNSSSHSYQQHHYSHNNNSTDEYKDSISLGGTLNRSTDKTLLKLTLSRQHSLQHQQKKNSLKRQRTTFSVDMNSDSQTTSSPLILPLNADHNETQPQIPQPQLPQLEVPELQVLQLQIPQILQPQVRQYPTQENEQLALSHQPLPKTDEVGMNLPRKSELQSDGKLEKNNLEGDNENVKEKDTNITINFEVNDHNEECEINADDVDKEGDEAGAEVWGNPAAKYGTVNENKNKKADTTNKNDCSAGDECTAENENQTDINKKKEMKGNEITNERDGGSFLEDPTPEYVIQIERFDMPNGGRPLINEEATNVPASIPFYFV
ncbi:hypothetical protein HELRODRAFT_168400 [Helobdella robusta]|uniref:Uncharacterized protein n=1 Tax=Helobdella robusta TaxID=6412 RepID=T1F0J9_HELRO|nr:hypothetical protein HELRODRAFT_168400 [Helobdella robusta]ESO09417.1 hypothetical protein HELRODRAFT_168400 [Helobdella robusta]